MIDETERLFREGGLLAQAPEIDEPILLAALDARYGITGRLVRLDTEADSTYRLRGERDGEPGEFLVKVSQPEEPLDVVRCQADVIAWIEATDPALPVQSIVPDRSGAPYGAFEDPVGSFRGLLRVHRFIPGSLLVEADPDPAQLREVGAALGRLDTALRNFEHPGTERVLVWDLARFVSFEPLIALEPDAGRRALAQRVFDGFAERVVPRLASARTQVIHGDFSPYNVVVDPGRDPGGFVTGIIDFGDTVRTPVVFDPAVLLCNHVREAPGHPWEAAGHLLAGYHREFPLEPDEVGMLVDATLARIALRALVSNWRISRGSDRADYIRTHAARDWIRLENALAHGYAAARDHLAAAICTPAA